MSQALVTLTCPSRPCPRPAHLLRDVPLQPLRRYQHEVRLAQAVPSVRVAQVEGVSAQDKLQGEGQADGPSLPPVPPPRNRPPVWAHYLPEVPYDWGVCPGVFCVEAQLAILEGNERERLVEPPAEGAGDEARQVGGPGAEGRGADLL